MIRNTILITLLIFFAIVIIDISSSKINSVEDISNLKKIKMYDNNGNLFYEINNLKESTYVSIDEISDIAIKTFIEIEDKRFYDHSGFDIYRIGRAIINNSRTKQVIGASTITQQYVKNIYLSSEKSIFRKIRELYYSIKLESIYDKNKILEGYLNSIYFNHGIYGIYNASKYYFNKEPSQLNLCESATLVAIIKAPSKYAPDINNNENIKRKNIILDVMLKNKKITKLEYDKAKNTKAKITKTKYYKYDSATLFYKDLVLTELDKTALSSRNIDVYTSFDTKLNTVVNNFIKDNNIDSSLSIIVINDKGEIILSTCKDYYENSYNTGIHSSRMIGSTIKPFIYYEALKNGMTLMSEFKSEPTTFYINHTPYIFKNYNDKYENKKITMGLAIATSDNIYAVKTHLYLGSKKLIKFLEKFDIKIKDSYPSLALGTQEMSLLKLTSIYNTFSTLGEYIKPHTINKINANNTSSYIYKPKKQILLDKDISYIINDALTNTFDTNMSNIVHVTGESISNKLNTKSSAKSGLTDYDSYMIGYTPLYTVGIWCGNTDNTPLTDSVSKAFPKQLYLEIMNYLMEQNKNIWYEKPNAVYSLFIDPTGFNSGYKKNVYFKD